jgi:hypothetical protein
MSRTRRLTPALGLIALAGLLSVVCMAGCAVTPPRADGDPDASTNTPCYVWAKAHHIPPETTTAESGYFALVEGLNGSVYIGTAAYGRNSYLVEFDPAAETMRVAFDTHKFLGLPLEPTGFAAQAKIHTRLFVGPSGTIYLGTMHGYPTAAEKKSGQWGIYSGGYVMTYDPATGQARNLGQPLPKDDRRLRAWPDPRLHGEGVQDVVADETHGLVYVVTTIGGYWMLGEIAHPEKGYRTLGLTLSDMTNTIIDRWGRATVMAREWFLARHDPRTGSTTLDEILLDGRPLREQVSGESSSADLRLAPDGRTAYMLRLLGDELRLIVLDLGGRVGQPVKARAVACPFDTGRRPRSRGTLAVAPDGGVYADVWMENRHHLVRYAPHRDHMDDLGVIAVRNPDYYDFAGPAATNEYGEARSRSGFKRLPDGTLMPTDNILAMHVARDGTLYATVLYPFTLLRFERAPSSR